jgi:hypothetical protein
VKIVEATEARDDAIERLGDGWICGVGETFLSADTVAVNLRAESPLNLGGRTAESNPIAPTGDLNTAEALGTQPVSDFRDVGIAQAKA